MGVFVGFTGRLLQDFVCCKFYVGSCWFRLVWFSGWIREDGINLVYCFGLVGCVDCGI